MTRKLIAELLGTAILVFFGCGTAALMFGMHLAGVWGAGVVVTALAFGLVLGGICYAFGAVSGAHVNPAVTLGALVAGRIKAIEAVVVLGRPVRRRHPRRARALGDALGLAVLLADADGARRERVRLAVAHPHELVGGLRHRDRDDGRLRVRDPRGHRQGRRSDRRGARHRAHARHGAPARDLRRRHERQPGALARPGAHRRGHRAQAGLAVHLRAARRRPPRRRRVPRDAPRRGRHGLRRRGRRPVRHRCGGRGGRDRAGARHPSACRPQRRTALGRRRAAGPVA